MASHSSGKQPQAPRDAKEAYVPSSEQEKGEESLPEERQTLLLHNEKVRLDLIVTLLRATVLAALCPHFPRATRASASDAKRFDNFIRRVEVRIERCGQDLAAYVRDLTIEGLVEIARNGIRRVADASEQILLDDELPADGRILYTMRTVTGALAALFKSFDRTFLSEDRVQELSGRIGSHKPLQPLNASAFVLPPKEAKPAVAFDDGGVEGEKFWTDIVDEWRKERGGERVGGGEKSRRERIRRLAASVARCSEVVPHRVLSLSELLERREEFLADVCRRTEVWRQEWNRNHPGEPLGSMENRCRLWLDELVTNISALGRKIPVDVALVMQENWNSAMIETMGHNWEREYAKALMKATREGFNVLFQNCPDLPDIPGIRLSQNVVCCYVADEQYFPDQSYVESIFRCICDHVRHATDGFFHEFVSDAQERRRLFTLRTALLKATTDVWDECIREGQWPIRSYEQLESFFTTSWRRIERCARSVNLEGEAAEQQEARGIVCNSFHIELARYFVNHLTFIPNLRPSKPPIAAEHPLLSAFAPPHEASPTAEVSDDREEMREDVCAEIDAAFPELNELPQLVVMDAEEIIRVWGESVSRHWMERLQWRKDGSISTAVAQAGMDFFQKAGVKALLPLAKRNLLVLLRRAPMTLEELIDASDTVRVVKRLWFSDAQVSALEDMKQQRNEDVRNEAKKAIPQQYPLPSVRLSEDVMYIVRNRASVPLVSALRTDWQELLKMAQEACARFDVLQHSRQRSRKRDRKQDDPIRDGRRAVFDALAKAGDDVFANGEEAIDSFDKLERLLMQAYEKATATVTEALSSMGDDRERERMQEGYCYILQKKIAALLLSTSSVYPKLSPPAELDAKNHSLLCSLIPREGVRGEGESAPEVSQEAEWRAEIDAACPELCEVPHMRTITVEDFMELWREMGMDEKAVEAWKVDAEAYIEEKKPQLRQKMMEDGGGEWNEHLEESLNVLVKEEIEGKKEQMRKDTAQFLQNVAAMAARRGCDLLTTRVEIPGGVDAVELKKVFEEFRDVALRRALPHTPVPGIPLSDRMAYLVVDPEASLSQKAITEYWGRMIGEMRDHWYAYAEGNIDGYCGARGEHSLREQCKKGLWHKISLLRDGILQEIKPPFASHAELRAFFDLALERVTEVVDGCPLQASDEVQRKIRATVLYGLQKKLARFYLSTQSFCPRLSPDDPQADAEYDLLNVLKGPKPVPGVIARLKGFDLGGLVRVPDVKLLLTDDARKYRDSFFDHIRKRVRAWGNDWNKNHPRQQVDVEGLTDAHIEFVTRWFDGLLADSEKTAKHVVVSADREILAGLRTGDECNDLQAECSALAKVEFWNDVLKDVPVVTHKDLPGSYGEENCMFIVCSPDVPFHSERWEKAVTTTIADVAALRSRTDAAIGSIVGIAPDAQEKGRRRRLLNIRNQLLVVLPQNFDQMCERLSPFICDYDQLRAAMHEAIHECETAIQSAASDGDPGEVQLIKDVFCHLIRQAVACLALGVQYSYPRLAPPPSADRSKDPLFSVLIPQSKKDADALSVQTGDQEAAVGKVDLLTHSFLSAWWDRTWENFLERHRIEHLPPEEKRSGDAILCARLSGFQRTIQLRVADIEKERALHDPERFDAFVEEMKDELAALPATVTVGKDEVDVPRGDWLRYFEHRLSELVGHLRPLIQETQAEASDPESLMQRREKLISGLLRLD